MELDLTAQLQPAVWGLLAGLLASASALVAAADRDEVDRLRRYWHLRRAWRRHLDHLRTFRERLQARLMSQPFLRRRGKV